MRRIQDWSTYFGALGIALVAVAFLLGVITSTRRDLLLLVGALGIILVAFYIITRPRDKSRQSAGVRTASNGINVIIIAVAVIGIIAAINFIASHQFDKRVDLTANKQHTLSQQTVQVLKSLNAPVNIIGFFTPETQSQEQDTQNLLKDYQLQTNQINVQYVDPDANPALAQKYDIAQSGTIVFEKGDRTEKLYTADESGFTNAILKVTQTQQPAIYFTTGHGEYDSQDSSQNGMSAIVNYLKQVNYKVEPLNLSAISGTLPADTRALIIAGPTKPFSAPDAKVVSDYLDKGGRVLLMTDPNTDTGLTDVLSKWGLSLQKNLILDPAQNYRGSPAIPVFSTFPDSPVTKGLATYGVYFPGASSITETVGTTSTLTALFTTSNQACAKTDFAALQSATADIQCTDTDPKGPFVIGYTSENGTGANADQHGRLVAIGNASFASNASINSQDALGNQQLLGNMVNWLAGQEQLIAVPPRDPGVRPLQTISGDDLNLVIWTSVVLIPLAALIIGGVLWWRSR